MKYLTIILILFAVPAFASDYDKNWPPLDAEVCFVVDTSQLYREKPKYVKKSFTIETKTIESIFDWIIVISNPLTDFDF